MAHDARGQVVQNVSVGIQCVITDEETAVGDSKVVHDGGGSVGAATQTDARRRWSAQSLAVGAGSLLVVRPPEDGGQSGLRQCRVVLKGLSRRSDLYGRQAKVLSEVQSELIAVEDLPKYGSIFAEMVMKPGGEKIKVRAANFNFVGDKS